MLTKDDFLSVLSSIMLTALAKHFCILERFLGKHQELFMNDQERMMPQTALMLQTQWISPSISN